MREEEKALSDVHTGHRQRLRERFLREGLASFTERETLELLLMYAIPQKDVSPLAGELLVRFGSLSGVLEADRASLLAVAGVGENAATLLSLMPQLMGRYEQSRLGERPALTDPASTVRYARTLFAGAQEERVFLICLDLSGRVLRAALLRRGTLDEVSLYPREVVEQALQAHAHAVILTHNHPGGTPQPSSADVETTRRVVDALGVVGIRALDHVIIGRDTAYSMASGGLIHNGRISQDGLRAGSAASPARQVPGLGWEAERK